MSKGHKSADWPTSSICEWTAGAAQHTWVPVLNIIMKNILLSILFLLLSAATAIRRWPDPPAWEKKPETARYLMHYADWGIVSAISPEYHYVPFGTLQSFADGPMDMSSGIPYFYIANVSDTYKNFQYNNTVALSVSMAESDYCERHKLDPEEPTCSRCSLLGKMLPVKDKVELLFAKDSLFSRHPAMAEWPQSHGWDFYKLSPYAVYLLDYYGGATHVPVEDYFAAKP